MSVKVLLVTGSMPPAFCGVGRYTVRLSEAIRKKGLEVRTSAMEGKPDFLFHSYAEFSSIFHSFTPNILHLQYPGIGFRHSLLPLRLLSSPHPAIVTLHEFSISHPLRKLFSLALTRRAQGVIVPAEAEFQALRPFCQARQPIYVVYPGPSFEPSATMQETEPQFSSPLFLFFGFLNRSKNIPLLIQVLHHYQKAGFPDPFLLFTATSREHPDAQKFLQWLKKEKLYEPDSEKMKVHFQYDENELSRLFWNGAVALLPFVDGVSPRRTSLLTLLAHGVVVLSTPPAPPPFIHGEGIFLHTRAEEFIETMKRLLNREEFIKQRQKALRLSQAFSWDSIGNAHLALYHRLLP